MLEMLKAEDKRKRMRCWNSIKFNSMNMNLGKLQEKVSDREGLPCYEVPGHKESHND